MDELTKKERDRIRHRRWLDNLKADPVRYAAYLAHHREYMRRYCAANRERVREASNNYRLTHMEQAAARVRRYYARHKDDPVWRARRRAYMLEYQKLRRAEKAGNYEIK